MYAFTSLLIQIIRKINMFVNDVNKYSDSSPAGLCVRNSEGIHALNDFFTENRLPGMLKAAEIKHRI